LIYDRARTERLFGFKYRLEMYVPKAEREFGHFVLPIVYGDRLIGRADPTFDRRAGVLSVRLHREPDAPDSRTVTRAIERSLEELRVFVGADQLRTEAASSGGSRGAGAGSRASRSD
jgi:uncharacterized protein YcaQ